MSCWYNPSTLKVRDEDGAAPETNCTGEGQPDLLLRLIAVSQAPSRTVSLGLRCILTSLWRHFEGGCATRRNPNHDGPLELMPDLCSCNSLMLSAHACCRPSFSAACMMKVHVAALRKSMCAANTLCRMMRLPLFCFEAVCLIKSDERYCTGLRRCRSTGCHHHRGRLLV